jgi:glycosyltransferase involved in cell wall biosynthesis
MPTVLIEALSLGTACIAFDCPTGPSEIIQHNKNGLLVANGDIAALAETLLNYKSLPKTGLRESVAEFSQHNVCQQYLQLLDGKTNV